MRNCRSLPLVFLTAGTLASCGTEVQTQNLSSADEVRPDLATVGYDTVLAPRVWAAQLYVEYDAIIIARSSGLAESVLVDLGDRVTEGQTILKLESIDQRLALWDAAELERVAARTRSRLEELTSGGLATVADSEQAVMEHERATLTVRRARRDLDLTTSTAPFNGRVADRFVRPLEMIEKGDSLFRISAMGPLRVSLRIPESESDGIAIGTEATVEGRNDLRATATVVRISPTVDAASGTVEYVLQLGPNSRMRPGSNVRVHLGRQSRAVLAIPHQALADGNYVLVWDNGRTRLRPVVTGSPLSDERIEIVSGLVAGERISLGQR